MATSSPTTSVADNDSRRRVVRTPIVSAWNGSATATKVLTDNVGLAQHQIWWTSTGATAGTMTISVRPAKGAFFVPIATVNLATTPNGVYFLQAILDDVQFSISGLAGTLAMNGGINSVGIDFTPGGNRSLVDRRRFQVKEVASGWNGAAAITTEAKELEGYSQHQLAIAGGVGNVKLQARPLGANNFVDVNLDTMTVSAGGALIIFPGMYDAFKLVPVGGLTGSINAQINSIGQEMFFPITPWQLEATLTASMIETALGYVPPNPATFPFSWRNRFINGNFDFWRRGTSFTLPSGVAAFQYTAERWRIDYTDINGGVVSQNTFSPASSGINPQAVYGLTVQNTGNGDSVNHFYALQQRIEDVRSFAGETVAVTFTVSNLGSTHPMAIEVQQIFGTGGSTQVNSNETVFSCLAGTHTYTLLLNIPSISGKTIGTSSSISIVWWFSVGTASSFSTRFPGLGANVNNLVFSSCQCELAVPDTVGQLGGTSYEIRPLEVEDALCMRYYENTFALGTNPANNMGSYPQYSGVAYSAGSVRQTYYFKVNKRSAPSITFYSSNVVAGGANGLWQVFISGSWNTGATATIGVVVSTNAFVTVDESFGSGLTAGQALLVAGHLAADCEL
jgi:hypothetical protein